MSKKKRKKQEQLHKFPVLICILFFCGLFGYMIVYLVNYVSENKQSLVNNSYNSRQEILLSQNYRGNIYSSDGKLLAQTLLSADGTETRYYPYDNLFAHTVGYSTHGKTGVEALANYYLINSDISTDEKVKNSLAEKKNPGNNVITTYNVTLQQLANKELNVYKGAIIMTEVKTGRVLAMVSHPDFDPNTIDEMYDTYAAQNGSELLNRATQGLYPPGSTFKIVTSLAYYREVGEDYKAYRFQCNGSYTHGTRKITCYHGSNHGSVDMLKSFAKSCNSFYANIGMKLDKDAFGDTVEDLLMNQELPYPSLYSKAALSVNSETDDDEMMQVSIGQGKTLITPLYLNMLTAAIANDGVLMEYQTIQSVENADGKTLKTFEPVEYKQILKSDEAEFLTMLMTEVVNSGTATRLKDLPFTVAGKTGSAEYGTVKGESHAWFTGFAPAEDPEICITVIVEGAGSGGDYAVPMVRDLLSTWYSVK